MVVGECVCMFVRMCLPVSLLGQREYSGGSPQSLPTRGGGPPSPFPQREIHSTVTQQYLIFNADKSCDLLFFRFLF